MSIQVRDLLKNAQTAYSRGDLASAESLLAAALQTSPNSVDALVLLGIVYARQSKASSAIKLLQNAVRLDQRCYEALVALSTLHFAAGEPEQAMIYGERAIALNRTDPKSYHHLARDLIAHSRPQDAIPYLRQAVKLAPADAALIQDLASALTETGQLSEAMDVWKRLTRFHPARIVGWLKLGSLYLAAKQFGEALVCAQRAIALDPSSADARMLAGLSHLGSDGAKEAEAEFEHAIKLGPNNMVAHSAYGLALHEMGRFEEARPYFERALEICPTNGQAYYSLVRSRKATPSDQPLLEKLKSVLEHRNASILDRSYMHYALGKAYEDLGSNELSMQSYDRATSLAFEAWFGNRGADRERYASIIQSTIDTCTSGVLASHERQKLCSEKPLIVVGMMRSGTTLVEQILSSHPDVKGAGELSYWNDQAAKFFDVQGRRIDDSLLMSRAQAYLDLLDQVGPGFQRVVDKYPHNYTMLGFIFAAIPTARVIYVKRSAVDNCLSIYTTAYERPPAFTLSKADIVFGYREHERIMAHWKQTLTSSQLLQVDYEDLIQSSEGTIRQMIDFAGLAWDEACLHPERTERSVNTPSVWQVRQPIYKSSVERWRKFEPWLGEFGELLDG